MKTQFPHTVRMSIGATFLEDIMASLTQTKSMHRLWTLVALLRTHLVGTLTLLCNSKRWKRSQCPPVGDWYNAGRYGV